MLRPFNTNTVLLELFTLTPLHDLLPATSLPLLVCMMILPYMMRHPFHVM